MKLPKSVTMPLSGAEVIDIRGLSCGDVELAGSGVTPVPGRLEKVFRRSGSCGSRAEDLEQTLGSRLFHKFNSSKRDI